MKFLLFLVLFSATSFAAPASKHTCRILFLNSPADGPKKLQLFDGSQCTEVELPRMNFSKVYELPAGPLNLRMLPAPPADPTKIPAEAPGAKIPEDMADFYLLVGSDPANTVAPVHMQIIDASADKLRLGQMLWYNLTKNRVGGLLGKERLDLQPETRVIVNAPASGPEDYPVNLGYREPGNEQFYPICQTSWRHDPRSRSVVFVFPEGGDQSPRVMVFPDYREPSPQKQK